MPLVYSVSSLPKWLTFDPRSQPFQETPSIEDEGHPEITVSAQDSTKTGSVSSQFSFMSLLCLPTSFHSEDALSAELSKSYFITMSAASIPPLSSPPIAKRVFCMHRVCTSFSSHHYDVNGIMHCLETSQPPTFPMTIWYMVSTILTERRCGFSVSRHVLRPRLSHPLENPTSNQCW